MIEIFFEMDGEKIDPNDLDDGKEVASINRIIQSIQNSVGTLRCKTHDQSPIIEVLGLNLENYCIEVAGCCADFIEKVYEKIHSEKC